MWGTLHLRFFLKIPPNIIPGEMGVDMSSINEVVEIVYNLVTKVVYENLYYRDQIIFIK